ncbi:2-oxo-4-hydroxy-4-carboxy-5-ureidoimidazoline decarboxylase [Achromobacter sp. SD115]|uniref:2-oxo-4-hydroxy-4-carboxy-5-ureidoimidazoline decarboxylase n=1 Tax=Achromobacter sp. SD115 TaxID=2782011 RepID=UPI001A958221|nr:2-oxo-4-hydroxy-4-carboxy-5-ureidoimidazoline decarboxylase [Achromobacter sp. SD115]MBO1017908.1 2-oxo-4-hydroxy-4-carboxy-5-ureidoimidazoline decarboxylase [Achromobacter sp. SD115]
MAHTLAQLNAAAPADAAAMLDGLYGHAPWIAERALAHRPFRSLADLGQRLRRSVSEADAAARTALLRAHPELAAAPGAPLGADSAREQDLAGLAGCTPAELARLQELNAAYKTRFGLPFVLAVRGPRGAGLTRQHVIDEFARRLDNPPDLEFEEAQQQLHRIAEIRLRERFDAEPAMGNDIWDWGEQLAVHSDPGYAEKGQLTVTYLTAAHRACAGLLSQWMRDCGFDEVGFDAVGNVVGRYLAARPDAPTLMTGSHYDTVRNAGKYDGRLGIFVPMACVRELHRQGKRLPYHLEVIGFAEEEGQRYRATFLGSGALIGDFKPEWLDQQDADGISMRDAMAQAGLRSEDIPKLKRDPARYLGFVEVHIEQGPVLYEMGLPLAVVTSINGCVRYQVRINGLACHAGTTPMNRRRDAATASAELALYVEQRAARDGDSVGTIGMLEVPGGSINVVPGECRFSLDLRAPSDTQRDALADDVLAELEAICQRRGLRYALEETMRAAAAPSDPVWQQRWERAVDALGLPVHRMPSGAGHDAMKLHEVMPQAMLFVRGQNSGISHNPRESTSSDDIQLAVLAFLRLLDDLAHDTQ